MIKAHKDANKQYALDKILEENGHSVMRLPPYHPDLNPIELLWGIIKRRVASRNVTFNLNDVSSLFKEEVALITADTFKNIWGKLQDCEAQYVEMEGNIDMMTDKFIIQCSSDSFSSENENDDE